MLKAIIAAALILQAAPRAGFVKAYVGHVEFVYPATLNLFDPKLLPPNTIALTNSGGQDGHGGIIPPNSFEILVAIDEGKASTINQFAIARAEGCKSVSKSTVRVGGKAATKIVCLDGYGPIQITETSVLVQNDRDLYKFFLDMIAGDPNEKTHVQIFDRILASVRFK